MRFQMKSLLCAAAAAGLLLGGSGALKAQTNQTPPAELCRLGIIHPFVGTWNETLNIPTAGTAAAMITLNLDQTLTETVVVDLVNLATPGHGVWKALDCRNYQVALTKLTFDPKEGGFGKEIFRGNAVLAADGNSWTATLQRQRFNGQGELYSTDTVTDAATRFVLDAPTQ